MNEYNERSHQSELDPRTCPVHVGLDVHKDSIVVAMARGPMHLNMLEVTEYGSLPNNPVRLIKLAEELKARFDEPVHFVYEAGPCGYVLWRRLKESGHSCSVVVPSLIPKRPGDRIKTDRRDAQQLAKLSRSGLLTEVWVPDEDQESMRDLVRQRTAYRCDILKQRQRLNHFLMRNGHVYKRTKWNDAHRTWMKDCKFDTRRQQISLISYLSTLEGLEQNLVELDRSLLNEANEWRWSTLVDSLRAIRGIDYLTAITIVAEIGDLRRFATAPQFMAYLGLVPSEHSSGGSRRTGAITKTGNNEVRRILIESAWTYRFAPRQTKHLQQKAKDASEYAKKRAWDAQVRLCSRYLKMVRKGKSHKTVITAIARELAGYIWDIGCQELNRQKELS